MSNFIRHVGIVVCDLNKALNFWCDGLDFKVLKAMEESGEYIDRLINLKSVQLRTVKIKDESDNIIELLKFDSHSTESVWHGTPYSNGITHLALTVKNLDALIKKLESFDFYPLSDVQYSTDGKVKLIYAKGPEGILLELVEEL